MSSPRSPNASSSTSSAFSNFLPRFRKEPSSSSSAGSPPDRSQSLSPSKLQEGASAESSSSSGRRLSISRNRRDLSPSPTSSSSQTISPRTSLTNIGSYARQQSMGNGDTSVSAAVKSSVSPPKLTLSHDGEVAGSAQSIIIPSPIDAFPPRGGLAAYGFNDTDDELRTPTAESGIGLIGRDLRVGSGSLSLDDVPSGVAPYAERASTPRPPSPRRESNSTASSFSVGSSSRRSSYHQQHATEPFPPSSSSLAAPISSPSLLPDPSASPDSNSKRRRRGLSASSFHRKPKPSQGIAGALAGISKDLVNPTQGLVQVKSRSSHDGQARSGRPRGDTGESVPASTASSGSKKSKKDKKENRKSVGSGRGEEVNEGGISRTRASSISYLSSTDGLSDSGFTDERASPRISQRELSAALGVDVDPSEFGSSDDDDEGLLDGSEDDLDGLHDEEEGYNVDDLPVTGFAVASVKRNAEFHALFENAVPEDDYLIEDYGCALQREILLQGRLYVSENHICFHANIFGWVTNLVLPFSEMVRIDKKMTALIIPNAIQVSTLHAKHTFASFLSRDTTYDVIHNIWRLSHPHLPSLNGAPSDGGSARQSNAGDISLERSISPGDARKARKQPTTCACGTKGEHYPEVAMDAVFPSAPEKVYNLIFASGFAKDFMVDDQKLMDLQISDWTPQNAASSNLLHRTMSYIKPLAGGFGPKQTKCELKDETLHVDMDDYVSMLTTTRTPDVPSGSVFSVKTRTCLMWAGSNSTRVLVTTKVEWTGRSFIKGIIESSALAGQKEFHGALEVAMRKYICDHPTEFHVEGMEDSDEDASLGLAQTAGPSSPALGGGPHGVVHRSVDEAKARAEQEGLVFQYGIDTLGKGSLEILKGGWALIESLWNACSVHGVLTLVIVGLVVSNVWTFVSLKSSKKVARRSPPRMMPRASVVGTGVGGESPDSVADAVKAFLEQYMLRSEEVGGCSEEVEGPSPADEVAAIGSALDALESRVGRLRAALADVRPVLGNALDSGFGLDEVD